LRILLPRQSKAEGISKQRHSARLIPRGCIQGRKKFNVEPRSVNQQQCRYYRSDGFNLYYGFQRSAEKGENNVYSESRKMRSRKDTTRSFRKRRSFTAIRLHNYGFDFCDRQALLAKLLEKGRSSQKKRQIESTIIPESKKQTSF
jgi:hypothetical protein